MSKFVVQCWDGSREPVIFSTYEDAADYITHVLGEEYWDTLHIEEVTEET